MQTQRKTFRLRCRPAKQGPRSLLSNQGRVEKSATGVTMMKKTRILYLSQGDEQLQSRLMDHLTSNSLLNSHQPAYCKHHSTETALLYIHDLLVSAIKSQKISCFSYSTSLLLLTLLTMTSWWPVSHPGLVSMALFSAGLSHIYIYRVARKNVPTFAWHYATE